MALGSVIGVAETSYHNSQLAAPYGFAFTLGDAALSRYRTTIERLAALCTVKTGLLAGAEIGAGVFVRGFTPKEILLAVATAIFNETACAYGRTTISMLILALSFAAIAFGVRVALEVTNAYAVLNAFTTAAMLVASVLVNP